MEVFKQPNFENKDSERARDAANMIRNGRFAEHDIAAAIRQTLRNSYVTNEADVKSAITRLSPLVVEILTNETPQDPHAEVAKDAEAVRIAEDFKSGNYLQDPEENPD